MPKKSRPALSDETRLLLQDLKDQLALASRALSAALGHNTRATQLLKDLEEK